MSQNMLFRLMCVALCFNRIRTEDDIQDFEFSDPASEIMIAQESRLYKTYVKPPIKIFKPSGVTNSHRPQYNIDSEEELKVNEALAELDLFETSTRKSTDKFYRPSYKIRAKESLIKEAVLRALERKDHVGKFAQLVPIIRSMSGSQRVALANLVASQVTTPPGRTPLNLAQVRSMFGHEANATSELMLPILLDLANLIRKAFRSTKDTRETKQHEQLPKAQMLRRSLQISEDDIEYIDSEPFDTGSKETKDSHNIQPKNIKQNTQTQNKTDFGMGQNITVDGNTSIDDYEDEANSSFISSSSSSTSTTTQSSLRPSHFKPLSSRNVSNKSLDLTADSTNHTLSQDLPVAEKLRSINRYLDRKGNLIRRGTFQKPLPVGSSPRRTTAEPATPAPPRRRPVQLPARKLPAPPSANPAEGKCEMFTNSLCLHSDDYPTEAIVSSIRRNKAAAGALLADFRDPGEGAVDGVTAAQEAKYTAEHYLVSNRRGDTANRDFASAGEAGFMCPSTVKYARPQRARATSGQWKYIVNTGEHTQTLRLEKCLKPKESCTYLTDNFKSKCVQVYNYHRLLTWDQQNGLHMDIFKVPTCCSCHIEGYSVSFPPLAAAARPQETSSENFPEEISAEHGNGAFESVQPSIHRPSVSKSPPPFGLKPLDTFSAISENHNLIPTAGFPHSKINDDEPLDSYSNSYFPDSFNQATSVRNVKRPHRNPVASSFDHVTLPSYLEPPNPLAANSFNFVKEIPSKYKITSSSQFKRGAPRPSRRPIRKKLSGAPDDLIPSGTSPVESFTSSSVETLEDFNDDLEDPELINEPKRQTIAPKLQSAINITKQEPNRHEPNRREPNRHESNRHESNRHESNRPEANKQPTHTHINGKRINYNYHPIIDFFGDETKDEEATNIDREDSEVSFIPPESEWKPINNPPSRSTSSGNGKRRY